MERFVTPAPAEIVWNILADVERWPEWTPTVIRVEPLSAGGLQTGARYRVSQPKLRPAIYEVTICEPPLRFTWMTAMPGMKMNADHRVTSIAEGTEVELSFASEGLLGGLIGRLYGTMIADYVATEARSLQARSETVAGAGLAGRQSGNGLRR